MNKKVFTTKNDLDQDVELAVLKASPKQQVEAQLVFNKAWRQAEENGNILRRDIEDIAKKRGLWTNEIKEKVDELERKIIDLEKQLRGGANSFDSLEKARDAAFEIRKLRGERITLLRPRLELDGVSCESFADMARTNFLISQTVVYNADGRKYFTNMDDFIAQSNNKVALDAAIAYYELNAEDQREENFEDTFLKKHFFTDSKGRLINKDKKLITDDGKLIDEQFRYINEDGKLININGDLVDEKGNPIVEYKEFDNV